MAGGFEVNPEPVNGYAKHYHMDLAMARPEIKLFRCSPESLLWLVKGREKPDFLFFDPPYFNKLAGQYTKDSTRGGGGGKGAGQGELGWTNQGLDTVPGSSAKCV